MGVLFGIRDLLAPACAGERVDVPVQAAPARVLLEVLNAVLVRLLVVRLEDST